MCIPSRTVVDAGSYLSIVGLPLVLENHPKKGASTKRGTRVTMSEVLILPLLHHRGRSQGVPMNWCTVRCEMQ